MFIAGHVGITLGAYAVSGRNREMTFRKILLLSIIALSPDILDRGLHILIPGYQNHGVFHSVLFYTMLLPVFYFFRRDALVYPSIMFLNVALDAVNTDLRVFLYPAYGWAPGFHGPVVRSVVESYMKGHPGGIGYKLPTGHFLVFEVIGTLIIIWTFLKAGRRARAGAGGGEEVS